MTRVLTKDWKKPLRWQKQAKDCSAFCDEQDPPRVLISMCDPFDKEVPEEWRSQFVRLIFQTPNLNWLVLTKRPEECRWIAPPKNVWLGVSVEDQQRADERIPILLSIPAAVRWLSVEPLLGPVDLALALDPCSKDCGKKTVGTPPFSGHWHKGSGESVNWVVVGGESGFNHRRMELDWLDSVVSQCKAAGVPVFVKQDSSRFSGEQGRIPSELWAFKQFPKS